MHPVEYDPQPQSASLGDYVRVVRNRWLAVTVATLIGVALGGVLIVRQQPAYLSTAQILVASLPTESGQPLEPDLETEAQVAQSVTVADMAADSLGLPGVDGRALLEHYTVLIPSDAAAVLEIDFIDGEPAVAERGAQAVAEAYLSFRQDQAETITKRLLDSFTDELGVLQEELQKQVSKQSENPPGSQPYNAATTQIAALQSTIDEINSRVVAVSGPITPGEVIGPASEAERADTSPIILLLGGAVLGFLAGLIAAFVIEGISGRVRDSRGVERDLEAQVLGSIPTIKDAKGPLVTRDDPNNPAAEAYRMLRSALLFRAQEDARVIMLTSGGIGDGKSTTAANLAVALAQADKKVILIGADLRRPSMDQFFDLESSKGLGAALANGAHPPVMPTGVENLALIPAGPPLEASAHLFETNAFPAMIRTCREQADFVIVDAPPLSISDPMLMATHVDGVVLVVDAGEATRSGLERVRDQLGRVGLRPFGAVLNRLSTHSEEYATYDYKYDMPTPKKKPKRR